MRHDAECAVPEGRAKDQLHQNRSRHPASQRAQARRAMIVERLKIALPPRAEIEREADDGDEEYLSERGMRGCGNRRESLKDPESTKRRLCQDQAKRGPSQAPCQRATLVKGEPQ